MYISKPIIPWVIITPERMTYAVTTFAAGQVVVLTGFRKINFEKLIAVPTEAINRSILNDGQHAPCIMTSFVTHPEVIGKPAMASEPINRKVYSTVLIFPDHFE